MSLDGGWALILATILGVVITGVGALIWRHVDGAQADADKAKEEVAKLRDEFLGYKAEVAERYAKVVEIERMESNIFTVMQRIEAKVDRLQEQRGEHHG